MEEKMIRIPIKKYRELQKHRKVDQELLTDIAEGIKDIINGRLEEV